MGLEIGAQRSVLMIRSTLNILFLSIACLCADTAGAHPHVWVTMSSELLYAADGSATGIRHAWTFDDAFSVYATQGLKSKKRGVFTREELAPLAETNVASLKEYDFFTFAKADGKKAHFNEPFDYFLEYDPKRTVLTLHFTLPFKTPVKAKQLSIDLYDPSAFIDFEFTEKNPMALVGAPAACELSVIRPGDGGLQVQPQRLSEAFFNSDVSTWARQFANKVSVKCP
jgi:ABC-type uncharacterized transport system substrate-binding protein